jgi:small conductance mechanosensitive channel
MNKKSKNKSLAVFSKSILRLTLNFIIIMISLMIIGVKGAAFAGLLGGAGLGIGLALKDTLSNFAGGMILIIFKAYDIGDFIEIDGQKGEVAGINVFATTLNTRDNKRILIPNGLVTNTHILNYTRNKMRRVDILFGIAYEADFREGIAILTKIAENHPKIYKTIEKTIRLREMADSSLNITFRVWCKADDYWDVYYDVMEEAKLKFDEAEISIPFPQMDIHIKGNEKY